MEKAFPALSMISNLTWVHKREGRKVKRREAMKSLKEQGSNHSLNRARPGCVCIIIGLEMEA